MKKIILILACVFAGEASFAKTKFSCTTDADEGYYVKKTMQIEIKNQSLLFAMPFNGETHEWQAGSDGKLNRVNPKTGWSTFSGFNSKKMFGDLSEGIADRGIYIYVSPDVMSGNVGPVSLWAIGSEVGLEKATYSCE